MQNHVTNRLTINGTPEQVNTDRRIPMTVRLKESDLFPPIKEWLQERGWEVYSEVSVEKRADIVRRPLRATVRSIGIKSNALG